MSNSSVATLVIGASGVLAMIAVAILGGVIRLVGQVGGMMASITQIRADLATQREDADREHAQLYDTLRDDRRATNERFLRMEGAVFRIGPAARGDGDG